MWISRRGQRQLYHTSEPNDRLLGDDSCRFNSRTATWQTTSARSCSRFILIIYPHTTVVCVSVWVCALVIDTFSLHYRTCHSKRVWSLIAKHAYFLTTVIQRCLYFIFKSNYPIIEWRTNCSLTIISFERVTSLFSNLSTVFVLCAPKSFLPVFIRQPLFFTNIPYTFKIFF